MKSTLAFLAVPFLASLSFAPGADTIAFGVPKGTKLAKHFETSLDLDKKSASLSVGGRDLPQELVDKIEMTNTASEVLEFEDEYVEIDGSRPKDLVRSFRKATKHQTKHVVMISAEPKEEAKDYESPLVDHAVQFTWNAKESKYERAFHGEKGEAEWLEKLKEDTDFLRVLPEEHGGKVEVGDSWKVDPKEFNQLVMPGGDLPFDKKDKDEDYDFDKNLSGEAEAKYTGQREVDGEKLGVIALTCKLSTHHETEGGEGPPLKLELSFELEGELLWDFEKKHMHSYELHGPVELTVSGKQEIEAKGQKMELKMRFELAGEMKSRGSVER